KDNFSFKRLKFVVAIHAPANNSDSYSITHLLSIDASCTGLACAPAVRTITQTVARRSFCMKLPYNRPGHLPSSLKSARYVRTLPCIVIRPKSQRRAARHPTFRLLGGGRTPSRRLAHNFSDLPEHRLDLIPSEYVTNDDMIGWCSDVGE